ncbi:MAG: response regulator transcription factor [Clostridia bacterium]|nr:response regulator transcription factor [Clostridia bacterium]
MKIAICDDNDLCREEALAAVSEYAENNPQNAVTVSVFSHAEDVMEAAKKNGGFDVYLLDIVMPHIDGIDLGLMLRREGYTGKVVYLTSSTEFAIESYKVRAHDYLMKPLDKDVLFSTLDELAEKLRSSNEKSIVIKTKESSIRVSCSSIMYAELSRRTVRYCLTTGKEIESTSLRVSFPEAVKPLTENSSFVLCGQSTVVNLHHITMVENDAVVFRERFRLPLGVKVCRELRSAWTDFWFTEGR